MAKDDEYLPGTDAALMKAYAIGASSIKQSGITLPNGALGFLVPEGFELEQVMPPDPPVSSIVRQNVVLYEIDSFIDYVNRFKVSGATRIFAAPGHLNSGQATIRAVLDYHESASKPGYNRHQAVFNPPYSDEWARWETLERKPMKQAEWAEMIEENRKDIRDPDGASLLELIRKFKASKVQSYEAVAYQNDGSMAISWQDKTTGVPGVIPVPEQIVLGIPVFYKGSPYRVDVFMRYRLSEGVLLFNIKRDRPDIIEDAAFTEITSNIAAKTDIPIYLGKVGT